MTLLRTITTSFILIIAAHSASGQNPRWAADAVWYQIFPERFRNGDPANDPTKGDIHFTAEHPWHISPWTSDWYELQPWERERSGEFYRVVFDRRYGGDIQGVIDKLDYIQELGVTALYFNPLFESISLHKYDASSYHHIDRTFGPDPRGDKRTMDLETDDPASWRWTRADSLFLVLVQRAHARGMKVVIDGVFNHSGTDFFAFRDVLENQRRSRYSEWYDVRRWDDDRTPFSEFVYKGWWDHASMPEFQEDANGFVPPVRQYFLNVTKRWMDPNGDGDPSDGVDGWRLDVANEVSHVFWKEWRRLVKSINPEAYIVGEIWDNAQEWLKGDEFDAVMNYRFTTACVKFFINGEYSPSAFAEELAKIRADYPDSTNFILQNLLESHDTDRLPSQIMNPGRAFDKANSPRDNPAYKTGAPTQDARRMQRLMTLFQMTYIGAPMVYYGSEAGMWGADDPDDRKPMVWSDLTYELEKAAPAMKTAEQTVKADTVRFDANLFAWYKKLIGIRNASQALRRGMIRIHTANDQTGVLAFERATKIEKMMVVINVSDAERTIPVEGSYNNMLDGSVTAGEVRVGAKQGLILRRTTE